MIMTIGDGDPLLARWKRGEGWVYVFTSDVKNKWAARWLRWPSFASFWRQLIKDGIKKEDEKTRYPIALTIGRHELHMVVDAINDNDVFVRNLNSTAIVTTPDGEKREVPLIQSAPGRYEACTEARQYGPYVVDVRHDSADEMVATSHGQGTYAYAEELLTTSPDLGRIQSLSNNTGGLSDPTPKEILKTYGQAIRHEAPVWHYALYVVLGLFLADIILRRIRFWPARTVRITE